MEIKNLIDLKCSEKCYEIDFGRPYLHNYVILDDLSGQIAL